MSAKTDDSAANIKIELRQLDSNIGAVSEAVDKLEEVFSTVISDRMPFPGNIVINGNTFAGEEATDIDPRSELARTLDDCGNRVNTIYTRLMDIMNRCDL